MTGEATDSSARLTVEEFDRRFDDGEDMGSFINWSQARHLGRPDCQLDLSLPAWMFDRLNDEASRRGVGTDALIKMWLADRLEEVRSVR